MNLSTKIFLIFLAMFAGAFYLTVSYMEHKEDLINSAYAEGYQAAKLDYVLGQ